MPQDSAKRYLETTRYEYGAWGSGVQQAHAQTIRTNIAEAGNALSTSSIFRDVNGFVSGTEQMQGPAFTRSFVNDAQGRALYVNQAGHVQRQLIVNGEVLARYGDAAEEVTPSGQSPKFAAVGDFNLLNAPLQPQQTTTAPSSYTVTEGDTLQAIARTLLGDANLWYRIAEANALTVSADAPLPSGLTLNIPQLTLNASNVNTFEPYDPTQVLGKTDPQMPALPAPKKKGGWFSSLVSIVVAVVLSMCGLGAIAVAVLSNIAGQAAGLITGTQDKFSWKSVAQSAISAGVTMGLDSAGLTVNTSNATFNAVANAAIANTITQGVNVATGLQDKFSWTNVAASAVGAGVGHMVGSAMGLNDPGFKNQSFAQQLGARLVKGLAAGTATAVARGGKVAIQQIAVDAFGQTLGESLAESMTGIQNTPQQKFRQAELKQQEALEDYAWRMDNDRMYEAQGTVPGGGTWEDEEAMFGYPPKAAPYSTPLLNQASKLRVELSGVGWTGDFKLEDGTWVHKPGDGDGATRMVQVPAGSPAPNVPGYVIDTEGRVFAGVRDVTYLPATTSSAQADFRRDEIERMNDDAASGYSSDSWVWTGVPASQSPEPVPQINTDWNLRGTAGFSGVNTWDAYRRVDVAATSRTHPEPR